MFTDWSQCTARADIFAESLSYTTYETLENYTTTQHLTIDGVLLVGSQETKFSLNDHFVDKYSFEKLAMLIVKGDINRNSGALRQASRLFHRSIVLNVGHELTSCQLNMDLRVECKGGSDLPNIGRNVEISPYFVKRENKLFRVTQFYLETDERPNTSYVYDNALARLVDQPILKSMASMLNLTPISVGDRSNFGYRLPNGTFSGALGEVEYGRTDLANARIILPLEGASNVQFLHPNLVTPFRYVVPKNYYLHPQREVRLVALAPEFLVVYFSILLWFPVGFQIFQYCSLKIQPKESKSQTTWISSVFMTYAVMTNITIAIREISSQRIYWMTLIWFQLITYSVFQGNMIKEVNMADSSRDIQTIQELMDSSLNIPLQPSVTAFFKYDEQTVTKYNLKNRIMLEEAEPDQLMFKLASTRSFAILFPQDLIEDLVPRFYDKQTGEDLLHVIPEAAYEFYSAMYVPVTSVFIEPFNRILEQFVENGLVVYGTDHMRFEARLSYISRRKGGGFIASDNQTTTVDMRALKEVMFLVIGVLALAVLVFCIELSLNIILSKKFSG